MNAAPLTLCDWMLVLAAYAYEVRDQPTMTDATYDRLCGMAAERDTRIPGFSAATGQWIHDSDLDLVGRLLDSALSRNDRKRDLHAPSIRAALAEEGIQLVCCRGENICWRG